MASGDLVPLDVILLSVQNYIMSTEITSTAVMDDLKEVCAALTSRRPVDPIVARRVHERAETVKLEIRRKGVTNVAVDLIREVREQE